MFSMGCMDSEPIWIQAGQILTMRTRTSRPPARPDGHVLPPHVSNDESYLAGHPAIGRMPAGGFVPAHPAWHASCNDKVLQEATGFEMTRKILACMFLLVAPLLAQNRLNGPPPGAIGPSIEASA